MSLNKSQLHQDKKKTAAPSYQKKNPNVESIEMELDQDAINYYRSQGYVIEYIDGGSVPEFEEGGSVISEHGWDYKKDGDNILTRHTGDTDWITTQGSIKETIQNKIYKEPAAIQTGMTDIAKVAKLPKGSDVQSLQQSLANEEYYLGPTGIDGKDGLFTQQALAAKNSGISAKDYNKRWASQPLATIPEVNVPSSIIEAAYGVERPVSSRLSTEAELSMAENEEGEDPDAWRKTIEADNAAAAAKKKKSEKGWRAPYTTEGSINAPIVNLGDEVFQHVDDFILSPTKQMNLDRDFSKIHADAGSCLAGALNCNQEFVSQHVGAQSIRGLMSQLDRADLTKYSIPSRGGTVDTKAKGEFKETPSYDAWEIGDALVGEGLAQDLYNISPDTYYDHDKGLGLRKDDAGTMTKELQGIIKDGKVPLGSLVLMGDAQGFYTSTKSGARNKHAASVVGFNTEGVPLVYDYGSLVPITDNKFKYGINRIVVPKGYENYTFDKLKKGKDARLSDLGFTPNKEGKQPKYHERKDVKPYVNDILRGIHKHAPTIANDYNIDANLLDKLSKRVVGLSGQETNFGNYGDRDLSWGRQAAIETESGLMNLAKQYAKSQKNLLKTAKGGEREGVPDWKLEIKAYNLVPDHDPDKIKAVFNQLRKKHPKAVVMDTYESSVGPLAIKDNKKYTENKLGISKGDLFGATVSDKKEFENSGPAALVHMIESYKKLESKFPDLTQDQLVDLSTIAYNNAGKAYDKDYVDFYIKNQKMPDGYLNKVKGFEADYAMYPEEKRDYKNEQKAKEEKAFAEEQERLARRKFEMEVGLLNPNQPAYKDTTPEMRNYQPESTNIDSDSSLQNYLDNQNKVSLDEELKGIEANSIPTDFYGRPLYTRQADKRTPEERSTRIGLGKNRQSVLKPLMKGGGEVKSAADLLKQYVLKNM